MDYFTILDHTYNFKSFIMYSIRFFGGILMTEKIPVCFVIRILMRNISYKSNILLILVRFHAEFQVIFNFNYFKFLIKRK